MEADLALILLFVGAFLLGVVRGAVRQLVAFGAWLVAFLVAVYLRPPLTDWLAPQLTDLSGHYISMLSFVVAFVLLLTIALTVVELGGRTIQISSRPWVDDVMGGLLMLGVAILSVAVLLLAMDTFYATDTRGGLTAEVGIVRDLNAAFERSAIAGALRTSVVPGLLALLGPLLPPDVRSFA